MKKPRGAGLFPMRPRRLELSTDHTVHKALNPARRASIR